MNVWVLLGVAIIFEVLATSLLKQSNGFTKWHWGMLSIFCYSICFWFFAPVLKVIPVGVAYAIWSGVGIAAVTIVGLLAFGQKLNPAQYGFIALIMVGAIGLNLSTKAVVA